MKSKLSALTLLASCLWAQNGSNSSVTSLDTLHFLEGTWQASTVGTKDGPVASGTYSFRRELNGHVLARHSGSDACKGPAGFDCDHHDLLYVYQDAAGQPLSAVYFDNEGHVIHYELSMPSPTEVVFMSASSSPGPRFRLVYKLQDGLMSGKFQMETPGQSAWKSYLEWSGGPRK